MEMKINSINIPTDVHHLKFRNWNEMYPQPCFYVLCTSSAKSLKQTCVASILLQTLSILAM